MRAGELPEKARLAHARLADHRDHLALPAARAIERITELLPLRAPADETCEPPSRGDLEPGARGAGAGQLEHLDRLAESFHRYRAEGRNLDEALGEAQRCRGEPDAAGRGELLQARGQVRRLAHGGVVHP